ncbi:tRNA cyclic N6-threonylcarbamoyladenosine(37) synthase TcdA [Reinekea blandensis]|uniref:tRNA threonylcarbamoyladenosine dehydratase n=1 Tax=Reinekea blandensis MED297 TaxID=314283 RepID=A4BBN7_9GAMM|nr:tRNA cyclic N6-threonylcarbamoyladenosine(37) synthase TcdA [Reinekea blandensis]EAR10372.1 molybdopterin biosynthesis MoeB protein [Reinekea sp. MED297] [Reinekea blandensis MED297]
MNVRFNLMQEVSQLAVSERFGGTQRLYGVQPTEWLSQAHFVVIGIGGVGSWAAEALARTAVGRLTLIDLDDVCVTNTNRQIHAMTGTVGQMKVDVMAERIRSINPDCVVDVHHAFVTPDNLSELIDPDVDGVIDAIDSLKPKAALIAYCRRQKIPMVTTGGAGGQTDPTQITVADLSRTKHDPLAAKTRQRLRKFHGFPAAEKGKFGIDCVYSTEQLVYPQADGSVCAAKPGAGNSTRLDCASGFGASVMVTASFGMTAAARLVERWLQRKERRNRLEMETV